MNHNGEIGCHIVKAFKWGNKKKSKKKYKKIC